MPLHEFFLYALTIILILALLRVATTFNTPYQQNQAFGLVCLAVVSIMGMVWWGNEFAITPWAMVLVFFAAACVVSLLFMCRQSDWHHQAHKASS